MKLSEWKSHIEDLIQKYGDIDVEYNDSCVNEKASGFAIGKEFVYKTASGITHSETEWYDEGYDELFKEDELIEIKYLFDITTIKEDK